VCVFAQEGFYDKGSNVLLIKDNKQFEQQVRCGIHSESCKCVAFVFAPNSLHRSKLDEVLGLYTFLYRWWSCAADVSVFWRVGQVLNSDFLWAIQFYREG